MEEYTTTMQDTTQFQYLNDIEEIINGYLTTAAIFWTLVFIFNVFVWLMILRYFRNKALEVRLDEQNSLLNQILIETRKLTPKEEIPQLKVKASENDTSLNDPDVMQKLLDKLGEQDSDLKE